MTELLGDGFARRRDRHRPVVLADAAADRLDLIEPGDAINAIGRVSRLSDGALGVLVTDPAAVSLGSDPTADSVATDPAALAPAGEWRAWRERRRGRAGRRVRGRRRVPAGRGRGARVASRHRAPVGRRHRPSTAPYPPVLAGRVAARIAAFAGVADPDAAGGPPQLADAAPPAADPLAGPGGPERGVSVGHAR